MIHLKGLNIIGITVPDMDGNDNIKTICENYAESEVIDFYTMDMEKLFTIAKYRVLPVPTLLVLAGTKAVLRVVKGIPTLNKFTKLIEAIGDNYEAR